jgi:hypothetical protein
MKTKSKKKPVKSALQVVNIKLTPATRALLIKKAKRHTEGNLSEWLRLAGLAYIPKTR